VITAVTLYVVAMLIGQSYSASFFAIPFFIGLSAGLFSKAHPYRDAFLSFLASALLSVVLLREGVVCLIFALPVFLPGVWAGAACGARFHRYAKSRAAQRNGLVGILALGFLTQVWEAWSDDPAHHPEHLARAEINLASSPERVFRALTDEPLRVSGRWQWFLRIGLPMPSEMRVLAPEQRVELKFNHGTAFADIREYRPNRVFAFQVTRYEIDDPPFHITRLGRGPHYGLRTERVQDWLTLEEVRYQLEPHGSGTRLIHEIRWRRHLAPDFYFGWLQQTVIDRGQRRLLDFIRRRVDSAPVSGGPLHVAAR
jgi:hypothetical protein